MELNFFNYLLKQTKKLT